MESGITVTELVTRIHEFNLSRGWERYHSPKSVACAITCEAAELLELFQWLTDEQSNSLDPIYLVNVAAEMADVLVFLLTLADVLNIDVARSVVEKLSANGKKYPVGQEFNPFGKASKPE